MTRRIVLAAIVLSAALALAAPRAVASARRGPSGEITVAAASSLTEVFGEIADEFERRYDDTTVTLNFGSSSTLEAQLEEGAPGDVFASADAENMDKLADADAVEGRTSVFARNRLAIAVEPGNPKRIESLADTVDSDVQLVLCDPEVPCGTYAREAYDKAGVPFPDVPTGLTAKDTLSKVALGEADAAVVYATDVEAAKGDVTGVAIPAADNVVVEYPIAVVAATGNADAATAFRKFVLSRSGRAILQQYGFLAP